MTYLAPVSRSSAGVGSAEHSFTAAEDAFTAAEDVSAATGAELSSKFAAESDYALEYGDLEVFFQGLDGLLGPPSMHARRAG